MDGGEGADVTEDLPLKLLSDPDFTSRNALAPKLSRRANGVVGAVLGAASPSSMAFSSIEGDPEPEAPLEKLSPLILALVKGDVWVGEPERPRVEMDILRRC